MFERDFFQRLGTAHVANCVAFPLAEYIVRDSYEGVFFAKHAAILANKTKPIHIRINSNTKMGFLLYYLAAQLSQVLWQGFRIMGKFAVHFSIQKNNFIDTERFQ